MVGGAVHGDDIATPRQGRWVTPQPCATAGTRPGRGRLGLEPSVQHADEEGAWMRSPRGVRAAHPHGPLVGQCGDGEGTRGGDSLLRVKRRPTKRAGDGECGEEVMTEGGGQ